ncbi:MAG: SEA (Seh1-associated) complex subunit [Chrysothrix sp. TS-e1954]|nr:MAG: SEA (Seh1-associated) complex subunit [Chrysothrix sp. TS-e1954]
MANQGRRQSTHPTPYATSRVPHPPPLPDAPTAVSLLEKFFPRTRRSAAVFSSSSTLPDELRNQPLYTSLSGHKTGLVIRALDVNQSRTHVVLAGGKILKTVKVHNQQDSSARCVEDVNIRSAAINYSSSAGSAGKPRRDSRNGVNDVASAHRETFDIEDVAWSNGNYASHIATAASSGKIMLYDLAKPGVEVGRLHEHSRQVHKVDFNPIEGSFLLSGSQDGTVRLWDLRASRSNVMICSSKDTFRGRSEGVRHTKWSPTHTWSFALGTDNGNVQRWDTRKNNAPILKIAAHSDTCNSVDWHPDGKHLVSAGKDRNVRVWNLNGHSRQQPECQLQAPREVQNVRWRPPCYVTSGNPDQLIKQCTHLATSYRNHPVVHIWDLRRTYMPFREFNHQVNGSTKDMLWHSRELLWTVGPEGEFCQSDIRDLPKTLDRRPMQAIDWASNDDLMFFAQKRPNNRHSNSDDQFELSGSPEEVRNHSRSPEMLFDGRGRGDDSLDENFLSKSMPKTHSRAASFISAKSLGSTPPSYEDHFRPVNSLDETMRQNDAVLVTQPARVGPFPGLPSGSVFAYFVRKLMTAHQPGSESRIDPTLLRKTCDQNARYAELANRTRTAQAWRILGLQFVQDFETYSTLNKSREVGISSQNGGLDGDIIAGNPKVSNVAVPTSDHVHTTSSVATPQAKPHTVEEPRIDGSEMQLDDAGRQQVLPGSVTINAVSGGSEQTDTCVESSSHSKLNEDLSKPSSSKRNAPLVADTESQGCSYRLKVSDGTHPSQSMAVPIPLNKNTSSGSFEMFSTSEDSPIKHPAYGSHVSETSTISASDVESSEGSPSFRRSESTHTSGGINESSSEEIFSTSDTSHMPPSSTAEQSFSHGKVAAAKKDSEVLKELLDVNGGTLKHGSQWTLELPDHVTPAMDESQFLQTNANAVRDAQTGVNHAEVNLNTIVDDHHVAEHADVSYAIETLSSLIHWHGTHSDSQMASHFFLFGLKVFAKLWHPPPSNTILDPVHDSYASYVAEYLSLSNSETSQLLAPELNALPSSLPPVLIESILSTYHTHLQSLSLNTASALLRGLAYPAYPAVYETTISDVDVSVLCNSCRNPINQLDANGACETCETKPAKCPICFSCISPYSLPLTKLPKKPKLDGTEPKTLDPSPSSPVASPKSHVPPAGESEPTLLYATCTLCNHALHLTCAYKWFLPTNSKDASSTPSDGTCPVAGCLCDCTRGFYRDLRQESETPAGRDSTLGRKASQRTALAPESIDPVHRGRGEDRAGVRPDDWQVLPSRAVKRVAGQLRQEDRGSMSDGEVEKGRIRSTSASFPPALGGSGGRMGSRKTSRATRSPLRGDDGSGRRVRLRSPRLHDVESKD